MSDGVGRRGGAKKTASKAEKSEPSRLLPFTRLIEDS